MQPRGDADKIRSPRLESQVALTREDVLNEYKRYPFEYHPLWISIVRGQLSLEQILRAEVQHYIRSDIGRNFRKKAAEESVLISPMVHDLLTETYKEECTEDESGPSHVDLVRFLLNSRGVSDSELEIAQPTPGNIAAIAIYKDITDRGPLHHMIGAGAVEFYYSALSPRIFDAYTSLYGLTPQEARTYEIHGPMDQVHAERALKVLEEPYAQQNGESILLAVRDAFVATSLHYDGMLQAALGTQSYWDGSERK